LVRQDGWKANLTLEHPDFVRDVVVYETGGWVVTACRDEEVRVWNRSVRVSLFFGLSMAYMLIKTDRSTASYFLWPLRRGHWACACRVNHCQRGN
jgi:hypothetical protein